MNTKNKKSKPRKHIGIVVSDYYESISGGLLKGAFRVLDNRVDVERKVVQVSGAWEIPLITQFLAESKEYDGIIALGAVIRGETSHFDFICEQCSSALMKISLEHKIPVGFGILTADSAKQAFHRSSGDDQHNKGVEAAQAVLSSVDLMDKLAL